MAKEIIPNERQKALANGYVNLGKTFKQAALDAGYAKGTAKVGPSFLRRHSVGVDMAFVEAARQQVWQPEDVKAIIRGRLLSDISRGKSSGVAKECDLLGSDRTVDMFVRTADVQVGVFAGIADSATSNLLSAATEDLKESEKK